MSRLAFAQRAVINGGSESLFQLGFAEQAEAFHAKLFILIAPGFELIHLVGLWNAVHIAPGEIAIDLVLLNALHEQGFRFLGKGKAFPRIVLSQLFFDFLLA